MGGTWRSCGFRAAERNSLSCPRQGGPEKQVAEFDAAENEQPLPALAWSPDGRNLAVVVGGPKQPPAIALISAGGGEPRRITNPPEGSDGDWSPAFSPDGSKLAFARGATGDSADLYVSSAGGANPERKTFDESGIRGIAWTANGADLIYAAARSNRIRLWRIAAAGGSPHEVAATAEEARYPSLARAGTRLVYTESPMLMSVWRGTLGAASASANANSDSAGERPLLRSSGRERLAVYSPDGRHIANVSDQSGFDEVWLSDADGGNRTQVTHFGASPDHPSPGRPVWSPDGRWLMFDASSNRGDELLKIAAGPGGKPARVLQGARSGAWSHDGKSIYYLINGRIWKADVDGGNPKQLTERGGGAPAESPDGKFVYFRMRGASVWRVPAQGGEEEPAIEADGPIMGDPLPTAGGVYYLVLERLARFERSFTLAYYDLKTRVSTAVFHISARNFAYTPMFSISPDRKYVLYSRVDQGATNLMLVENFK